MNIDIKIKVQLKDYGSLPLNQTASFLRDKIKSDEV